EGAAAERVQLCRDEIELRWEIAKDELQDGVPIGHVGGHAGEQRERQEEERKQREQRVIRYRGRVREVVAVVEALESVPERETGQPENVGGDAPGASEAAAT